jgi:hypothetical protein
MEAGDSYLHHVVHLSQVADSRVDGRERIIGAEQYVNVFGMYFVQLRIALRKSAGL